MLGVGNDSAVERGIDVWRRLAAGVRRQPCMELWWRTYTGPMAEERPVIKSRFGSLGEWGAWVAAHAGRERGDGNRTVLVGAGGRPATREELVRFVAEQNARHARENDHG